MRRDHLEISSGTSSNNVENMETADYYSRICNKINHTETQGQSHQRSTRYKASHIAKVWLQVKLVDSLKDQALNREKVLIDPFLQYQCRPVTQRSNCSPLARIQSQEKFILEEKFNIFRFMKGNMQMVQNLV